MSEVIFQVGDVVQLNSGGPVGTVVSIQAKLVSFAYFNTISGTFDQYTTVDKTLTLKQPNQPVKPANTRSSFGHGPIHD